MTTKIQFPQILAKCLVSLPLEQQTGGFGPQNKTLRVTILRTLTGEKIPVSKCGAHAVETALCKFFGIDSANMAGCHVDDAIRRELTLAAASHAAA